MAIQIARFIAPIFAPAAETSLYASPPGSFSRIDKLTVSNKDTAAQTITIHVVQSGGTAGTSNATTVLQAIKPNETWNSPNELGLVLGPGDFISCIASVANQLVIAASGVLQT